MNEQIDWSKAPVDATHYDADPERTGSYMKLEGDAWFFWPPFSEAPTWNRWDRHGKMDRSKIVPRPQTPTWNGPEDGLPPVGLEVEVLWIVHPREYVSCKVLAHDEGRAVFRFTSGKRKGEYQSDLLYFSVGNETPNFRPIRTAEQLAAEERERQIQHIISDILGGHGHTKRQRAELIYDAGYRKTQP